MLKRVVPKRAVLSRARAGPGRAARLATYTIDHAILDYAWVVDRRVGACLDHVDEAGQVVGCKRASHVL